MKGQLLCVWTGRIKAMLSNMWRPDVWCETMRHRVGTYEEECQSRQEHDRYAGSSDWSLPSGGVLEGYFEAHAGTPSTHSTRDNRVRTLKGQLLQCVSTGSIKAMFSHRWLWFSATNGYFDRLYWSTCNQRDLSWVSSYMQPIGIFNRWLGLHTNNWNLNTVLVYTQPAGILMCFGLLAANENLRTAFAASGNFD